MHAVNTIKMKREKNMIGEAPIVMTNEFARLFD